MGGSSSSTRLRSDFLGSPSNCFTIRYLRAFTMLPVLNVRLTTPRTLDNDTDICFFQFKRSTMLPVDVAFARYLTHATIDCQIPRYCFYFFILCKYFHVFLWFNVLLAYRPFSRFVWKHVFEIYCISRSYNFCYPTCFIRLQVQVSFFLN